MCKFTQIEVMGKTFGCRIKLHPPPSWNRIKQRNIIADGKQIAAAMLSQSNFLKVAIPQTQTFAVTFSNVSNNNTDSFPRYVK